MAAPSASLLSLAIALYLLGLGWNFAYVAGSALLSDELSPTERAKTQGFNDLMLGVASAAGSFGGGMMFAASGYWSLGLAGALAALVPLGLAVWWDEDDWHHLLTPNRRFSISIPQFRGHHT
jgi:predicted MFS family arabinose efflux permease